MHDGGDDRDEFGRGPEESFELAIEVCDEWGDWELEDGGSDLVPIIAKAEQARALSDVRDPVLEGLARELSGLLNAIESGEGSGVISLSSRMVDEVCEQVD